jgi:uncharacterized membrane protein (DUF485 family)
MNLRDYVFGRKAVLTSRLSKEEIVRRINAQAGSAFLPFSDGVCGGVYLGRVRLSVRNPYFSNGFQPIFAGKLVENLGQTELPASFGAPLYLRLFYAFWYLFLGFFLVGLLSSDLTPGSEAISIIIPIAMMLAPIAFHFIFNRNADVHYDEILHFLDIEADLRQEASPKVL